MNATPEASDTSDREVVVSRVINGPRHLVFEAYTEIRHLSRWWGPDGFTITTRSFEFRPGGRWEFVMHAPDGTDYPNHVEWLEIVRPERIVHRHGTRHGDPDAFISTTTFEEQAPGKTLVTLRSVLNTKEQRDRLVEHFAAVEGAQQTLDHLASYVATGALRA
ncbi:SRPBCC family protein [Actinomadura adrarensis]|uniref:SRPBCC family protein n=1 Tax=Actinomadura adrarensis TaxID=1819600 RepID=A0ABW3CNN7_9ACTN